MGRGAMANLDRRGPHPADAAAPKSSLGRFVLGLAVGAALVVPSLLLLFRVFKASQSPTESIDGSSGAD